MDCNECKGMTNQELRRYMGCGWEPPCKRTGAPGDGSQGLPLGFPGSNDECPGYLIALPEVLDAARALEWKREGLLRDYFDGDEITPLARDALDIIASEIKSVERHALRAAREGHGPR